ncbi:MAG: Unknown protein [uncultured Sulfurovum sp.]|uniref:Lipoprotein n=1 Tax=uncultured Sulfurovum sp. TaxID=269237 RepID=A0A6S6T5C0_9BACT|nr:MAG: Unknown protein [uncultured Sulfurovum sp.]
MKSLYIATIAGFLLVGCANNYPTNHIPAKTTHVAEEKPDKYPHPPEDLRSVVGHDGWYRHGSYYYPSRYYYNRYSDYYRYRY